MRKNKIQICERSVNFFRLWRALGVSFEKKIPPAAGLDFRLSILKKIFPPAAGSEFPRLLIISKD